MQVTGELSELDTIGHLIYYADYQPIKRQKHDNISLIGHNWTYLQ